MKAETPIQKCIKLIKEQRDRAQKEDAFLMFMAFEYCYLTLQNHLELEEQYYEFNENDIIFAIQEAYGHGRDEADDDLYNQVERSIKVILECIRNKKNKPLAFN